MARGHYFIKSDEPAQRLRHGRLALSRGRCRMPVEAIVEKLVWLDFERAGEFFQSRKRRRGVPTFYPRNIRAQQPGSPFDIALRQSSGFAQRAQALANLHSAI